MTKSISLVAACCRSHGIGNNGNLPWRLKKEMEFFTRITSTVSIEDDNSSGDEMVKKNAVIMGIRTYMCIPPRFRPLKGRINVVLSRTATETPAGASYLFRNLSDAIETLSTLPEIDRLFVIGGESVYKEASSKPETEYIFLTRIDADFDCDRFFPEIDLNQFEDLTLYDVNDFNNSEDSEEKKQILKKFAIPKGVQNENGLSYQYHLYRRIKQ